MELPDETLRDVKRRLHKVTGQIKGVEQMLDDGRDCRDVVTQLSAANKALEQVGFVLVAAGLEWCVTHPEEAADDGLEIDDVRRMFLKLA